MTIVTSPLHPYYTCVERMPDEEFEETSPDDDVPDGLHDEDLDDSDDEADPAISSAMFQHWVTHGQYTLPLAKVPDDGLMKSVAYPMAT